MLLLSRKGEVVTRETLFSNIVDPRGGTSTSNNLNQYILNLRKQLVYLGLETNVIVTIPRVGFRIPAEIQVVTTLSPQNGTTKAHQTGGHSRASLAWIALMIAITLAALCFEWLNDEYEAAWDGFPTLIRFPE